MSTVAEFLALLSSNGSDAIYHRDDGATHCPCRTPEGFRDPEWHLANPTIPECNEAGMLPNFVQYTVKAFVQPIQSTRATRLSTEQILMLFSDIQADDHLGIFPILWGGNTLNFYNWGEASEDYIVYNLRRFTVVNANKIPDPSDGVPDHHWEVGLRLINAEAF